MPSWWKGKSKLKSKSTSSPRKKDAEAPPSPAATAVVEEVVITPRSGREKKKKEKTNGSVLLGRIDRHVAGLDFRHRLPLPTSVSTPLPASASGSAWASRSSVSSSGSSDDTPHQPATSVIEEEVITPRNGREKKKKKEKTIDSILFGRIEGFRKYYPSPIYDGVAAGRHEAGFDFGHRLPLPMSVSNSTPLPASASGSAWASGSSVSSSCSSDDTTHPRLFRYSDPVSTSRSRNVMLDLQRHEHANEDRHLFASSPAVEHPIRYEGAASPVREFQVHGSDAYSRGGAGYSHGRTSVSMETAFSRKAGGSSSPRSNVVNPLSTSPVHPTAFVLSPASTNFRQDNLRSPSHPLPLPPSSPGSSSTSSSLRSPRSQWKKGKLLGRGTFGHVYLGFNRENGLMCAIKEVKDISDDANSKECLRQLNQEITLLRQLSHPNIVQYYGSDLVDDTLSVFIEYVSGGSIHKILQEYGPLEESLIRSYTAQILSGLAYLHGKNTVHRDIKGANILVGPNGEIKLADFGMAKSISSYMSMRSFKGSPYWMAPEVIMNGNGYNLSVDIWSLGCTVIEMANGKPPWSQYEGVPAIFKIANSKDTPDIPEHLSSEAKAFLKQCFQREPSARPSAVQLMDHPFVRDQPTIKAYRLNAIKDALPSFSDYAPTSTELSSIRTTSTLSDREYAVRARRSPVALPSSYKNTSDFSSARTNMSLPVSPCSSPLRQFKQSSRSSFPSPPHPAFTVGAGNYSPINHAHYPTRQINNISDPWLDMNQPRSPSPYDSPRRPSTGL